ncbi:hypothetical protein EYF80_057789 [Liparis tanakae]|uniref:Uncharacterized protein n=1 Tax=Liparis tanakae TaxID=230148 RepID=A0A4Z2EUW8_9TELE|nr:hypothetical protein EYF80_057789 [Liparis tanakae]
MQTAGVTRDRRTSVERRAARSGVPERRAARSGVLHGAACRSGVLHGAACWSGVLHGAACCTERRAAAACWRRHASASTLLVLSVWTQRDGLLNGRNGPMLTTSATQKLKDSDISDCQSPVWLANDDIIISLWEASILDPSLLLDRMRDGGSQ